MAGQATMTSAEFDALWGEVSNWARWGGASARGTLNYLSADRIAAAATLVRVGHTVSLGLPLDTQSRPDNPVPARHQMTQLAKDGSGRVRFAKDFIGVDYHNDGQSHLDALSHVSFRGSLFDGAPDSSIDADGANLGDVENVRNGIVGRGVLIDIPRLRNTSWVEPGDEVQADEILAAAQAENLLIGEGDILLVRTGHTLRLKQLGPWDTTQHKAGLHAGTAKLLRQRHVAALGCDTNSDTAPSRIELVPFPIHVLAVNAMGMYLLDYLQLDELAETCERLDRWEFLCVVAPLRIVRGTGSPVNPIAVF